MRRRHVLMLAGGILVAGVTVAYAAGFSLTSKRLTVLSTAAPSTSSSSTPTTTAPDNSMTIALANGSGQTVRRADLDDSVVITFDPTVKPTTFCSGWAGSATSFDLGTGSNDVKIKIVDGGASNDTLVVSGFSSSLTCTGGFRLGTINLGSTAYVSSGDLEFFGNGNNKSSVVWTPPVAPATTGSMEIILGTLQPGGGTRGALAATPSTTTTFTPDSNLRDVNDKAVTGTATTTSTF